jgi:cysteine-rich repeat protein
MRGQLGCYNDVHIVASSSALGNLDDEALSNWSCSIHEAFVTYPPSFQALAIAAGVTGPGSQTFGDGTSGLPYIISRGATPAGCGDGTWDEDLAEECDDGNTLDGDGCDKSCRCEVGYRADGKGKCLEIVTTSAFGCPAPPATSSASSMSSTPGYAEPPNYGTY